MKVLITAGGTREPIDGVRYIGNFSTGKTGAVIAERLEEVGQEITYLHGPDAVKPNLSSARLLTYTSATDLDHRLKSILSEEDFDSVIHMAAVSDFRVATLNGLDASQFVDSKLDSAEELEIKLIKNKKILTHLKSYSKNKNIKVIGFKLTNNADEELKQKKLKRIFDAGDVDYIVHNDLAEISDNSHKATIYKRDKILCQSMDKQELSQNLLNLIMETQK